METGLIFSKVDHTVLKSASTWSEVEKLCTEAIEYKMASVCIPPSYVKRAKDSFPELNVCTVIGFPLGYSTTKVKVFESKTAIEDGADEIDIVINIGDVKNGDYDAVLSEIKEIRSVSVGKILKVIIETCYLTEEEKKKLCEIVTEARADFIKTSTGFGTAGATIEDVNLMREHIGKEVRIKAAGGIRTREDMEAYIDAGCSRLGCSAAINALS